MGSFPSEPGSNPASLIALRGAPPQGPVDPGSVRSLLIVNLGGLGDLILSTPSLAALRTHFSGARIHAVVHARGAQALDGLDLVDEIHVLEEPWGNSAADALRWLALAWRLRRSGIDLALNMRTIASRRGRWMMRGFMAFSGATVTAGRNTDGRGSFYDVWVPESYTEMRPEAEFDRALVQAIGTPPPTGRPRVAVSDEDERAAAEILSSATRPQAVRIALSLGAGWETKRWPLERFLEVGVRLEEVRRPQWVLVGSREEHNIAEAFRRGAPALHVIDAVGRTPLGVLAAILKRMDLLLANDSGVIHVACSMGTRGVLIYGPGQVARYRPQWNPELYRVIHAGVPCSPCEWRRCPNTGETHQICLTSIGVEQVFQSCISLLDQAPEKKEGRT